MEKLFKQVGDEVSEFTTEEYAQHAKDVADAKAAAAKIAKEEKDNALAKAALLDRLGLTDAEAKLLLS
jgi:hypothetical protein